VRSETSSGSLRGGQLYPEEAVRWSHSTGCEGSYSLLLTPYSSLPPHRRLNPAEIRLVSGNDVDGDDLGDRIGMERSDQGL
jgi:hypothetical protein